MILISKLIKLSSHIAPMPISDRPLVKQIMLICFISAKFLLYGINVVHFFQTTTLLAALSAGVKTNIL